MPTGDVLTGWLQNFIELLPWVAVVFAACLLAFFVGLAVLKVLAHYRLLRQKVALLELTPPSQAEKSVDMTKRLFAMLHGLDASRSALDKMLLRRPVFTVEVVSTKEQGIRYMLRVAESEAEVFEQAVISYLPDVKIQRIDEYLPEEINGRVLDIRQTGHFAYPLQSQGFIDQHDPMAYLTGAMTKLSPGEFMAAQFVMSPVKVREAKTLASRILHNEELLQRLGKPRFPGLERIFAPVHAVLLAVMDGVGETVSGTSGRNRPESPVSAHKQQVALKEKPARVLSQFEQALAESVHDKLSQPLFSVNIRVLAVTETKKREQQRVRGIRDWLALFEVPTYQSLRPRMALPLRPVRRYLSFMFRYRLPALFRSNTSLLSAGEVAEICHFPHPTAARTENVVKSLSKTLPAPVSLKNRAKFDVVLGQNLYHGTETDIGLTAAERERHVYVIGGTGHGKTTMLQYSIVQDIKNGKGVAVIDPHGDMSENLLRYIPEERLDDVIYFNPADLTHPIGLNLLELPEGVTGDQLLLEQDFVTESVVSIFRKIFSEDGSGGHRIEYMLRNAVQTAFSVEGATLFTIYDIINDPKYRKQVVSKLEDEQLKNFWNNEFSKAGDYQRVKMAAGITAKIGRFLRSEVAKRVLEQPKSTINFGEILDGKILICNLSKGMIGEDTSELFGIGILAKLQLASLRRARISQSERKPFYLYVDEFQNFATVSFIEMLSEARKYKLFLTMAEQSTTQQDERRLVDIILANVGTVICFRTGSPADEYMLLPLFKPYIDEGEIANIPSYNFYARLSAVHAQEPVSGTTLLLNDDGTETAVRDVIKHSREKYGTKKSNKKQPKQQPSQSKPKKTNTPKRKKSTKKKAATNYGETKPV